MSRYLTYELSSQLKTALACFDIELSLDKQNLLLLYFEKLHSFNEHTNLTAIRDPKESLILNIVDSLLYAKVIDEFQAYKATASLGHIKYIDIGSGGGLPAFPLAISQGCCMTCVESVKKKARFLQETARELRLTIQVYDERVELLSANEEHRTQYGVVTARALDTLPVLLEYASPLLSLGGIAVFSKAYIDEPELSQGAKAAQLVGMKLCDSREFFLPDNKGYRKLLVYSKDSEPEINLPRAVGRAHKRPLG